MRLCKQVCQRWLDAVRSNVAVIKLLLTAFSNSRSAPDTLTHISENLEIIKSRLGNIFGNIVIRFAFGGYTDSLSNLIKLLGICNLIIRSFAFSHFKHCMGHMTGMLTVSSSAGQKHGTGTPGSDCPGIGTTNTLALRSGISSYTARSHHTEPAAGPFISELALRLLRNGTVKGSNDTLFLCPVNHLESSRVRSTLNVLGFKYPGCIWRFAGMVCVFKSWH